VLVPSDPLSVAVLLLSGFSLAVVMLVNLCVWWGSSVGLVWSLMLVTCGVTLQLRNTSGMSPSLLQRGMGCGLYIIMRSSLPRVGLLLLAVLLSLSLIQIVALLEVLLLTNHRKRHRHCKRHRHASIATSTAIATSTTSAMPLSPSPPLPSAPCLYRHRKRHLHRKHHRHFYRHRWYLYRHRHLYILFCFKIEK